MNESLLGGAAAPEGTAAPTASAESPAAGADWRESLPEDARGFIETKGWKEPADVLKGYRHLESLMGADKAGRGVLLPRDENDAEGREALYKALGRPEAPEGYELAAMLDGQEADPQFMGAMAGVMHQAGLSKDQGRALAAAYQQRYQAAIEGQEQKYLAERAELERGIAPAELEAARRVCRLSGVSQEELAALERLAGPKRLVPMLAKIGAALSEDRPANGAEPNQGHFSPAGAGTKISELLADPVFSKRYMAGEKSALEQIERLSKIAAGIKE